MTPPKPPTNVTCSPAHAALASAFLDWHADPARTCGGGGAGAASLLQRVAGLWKAGGLAAAASDPEENCEEWALAHALRSASGALSALRARPEVEALRTRVALVLLTAPHGVRWVDAKQRAKARSLAGSKRLHALIAECTASAAAAPSAAAPGRPLAHTPLQKLLARQRVRLRAAGGGTAAAADSGARLQLATGGMMPLLGITAAGGTAAGCHGGHEWLFDAPDHSAPRLSLTPTAACAAQPNASLYASVLRHTRVRWVDAAAARGTEQARAAAPISSGGHTALILPLPLSLSLWGEACRSAPRPSTNLLGAFLQAAGRGALASGVARHQLFLTSSAWLSLDWQHTRIRVHSD